MTNSNSLLLHQGKVYKLFRVLGQDRTLSMLRKDITVFLQPITMLLLSLTFHLVFYYHQNFLELSDKDSASLDIVTDTIEVMEAGGDIIIEEIVTAIFIHCGDILG